MRDKLLSEWYQDLIELSLKRYGYAIPLEDAKVMLILKNFKFRIDENGNEYIINYYKNKTL